MEIRTYKETDGPQVWPVVEQIIRKGDTFCYAPLQTEEQAHVLWVVPPPGHVVVVVEDQRVLPPLRHRTPAQLRASALP